MSTPLATVTERFGSKEKLTAAVENLMSDELWIPRLSEDGEGNKGLKHVSNRKLLKLHDTLTLVKKEFGTRSKLIDAVLDSEKRSKDADYRTKLDSYPVARLYDLYKTRQAKTAKKS